MDCQGGRPKNLVQPCPGKGQRPPRILDMALNDKIFQFMRIREWPSPENGPTFNVATMHQVAASKAQEDKQ
eukprot:7205492-Karenia_brevis.AAC.1